MTEGPAPLLLVEAKSTKDQVDRGIRYLRERFPAADAVQVTATGTQDYVTADGIRVCPAREFLRSLV